MTVRGVRWPRCALWDCGCGTWACEVCAGGGNPNSDPMMTMIAPTQPMAAACRDDVCPACGYPDLPGIEPETLHLLVGAEAVGGWLLADGRMPVHAKGRIYLMPEDAWRAYKRLCASREGMLKGLEVAA